MTLQHLPRLLEQHSAAELAGDEGRERNVAGGRNFDFEQIRAAEFGFEMLQSACSTFV